MASRRRFPAVSCSASSPQSSNQTSQPFFWRLSSMDLFANDHYTHPRAFANMLQHVCQSLLDIIFAPYFRYIRVWNRPLWSPSAMSAAALTQCAKIRGSIAKMRKHLKRKKRHRESQTEKLFLQQPRLQSLLPFRNNSRPTSRGGRLELSPSPKRSPPIYSRMSRHVTSPDQQILPDIKIHVHHQRANSSS